MRVCVCVCACGREGGREGGKLIVPHPIILHNDLFQDKKIVFIVLTTYVCVCVTTSCASKTWQILIGRPKLDWVWHMLVLGCHSREFAFLFYQLLLHLR